MWIKTSHLCEHKTGVLIALGRWQASLPFSTVVFLTCTWWLRQLLLAPRTVPATLEHCTQDGWPGSPPTALEAPVHWDEVYIWPRRPLSQGALAPTHCSGSEFLFSRHSKRPLFLGFELESLFRELCLCYCLRGRSILHVSARPAKFSLVLVILYT